MYLPPGVTPTDFAAAIRHFETAVGKEWVFTKDEDVDLYKDSFSPFLGEPEERVASAAVAPDSVEQVQQIVRIANQYKIPLYAISTGRNLGYGGSAPVYSGCVVVDLKRMNRILEVSEDHASVLVEPGVSYFDLYRHIKERKLKVWVDVPDPGWGSLVGNALDHGGGYTRPYFRNHFDAHCGMEVVLPNAELIRTGMGALPGSKTWQQYKFGVGPWVDGIFSQSNFGIVTKMGFWLMPQPEAYFSGTVYAQKHEDLHQLIRVLTILEDGGITNGMPDTSSPLLGIISIAEQARMLAVDTPQAAEEPQLLALRDKAATGDYTGLESYGQRKGIPYWSATIKFYGPAKVVPLQWEYCKEKFSAIAGATFKDGELVRFPLASDPTDQARFPEFGIPSLNNFSIGAESSTNPQPLHGHMWFTCIIPRTGAAIIEVNQMFAAAAREFGLPELRFQLPAWYWQRSAICIFGFPVTTDIETNKKNRGHIFRLIEMAAKKGWGEYRTPPAYQDAVVGAYSFNNHSLLKFHESIKDAIDPNGILSPGRYGIWPKHLRKKI
jgi:(+)-pinoresinol hydroxylase